MYESFFQLKAKPFELLPNPDFLYPATSHRKAATYLDHALNERAGFMVLTGEVGSGKTTLLRDLIKRNREGVAVSHVFNTSVDAAQLLALISDDFGLPVQGKDKAQLLLELNQFLVELYARGEIALLIIDEAQNLSPEALEEVRLLSNLETEDRKLLQIILSGQPELRRTLAQPSLLQLRQRIALSFHLEPLTAGEVKEYIGHRLSVAGEADAVNFAGEVIEMIWRYSRGIPRLINVICDFLLLSAFAAESREITTVLAREVVGELDFENHFWGDFGASAPRTAVVNSAPAAEAAPAGDAGAAAIRQALEEIRASLQAIEAKSAASSLQAVAELAGRLESQSLAMSEYMQQTRERLEKLESEQEEEIEEAEIVPDEVTVGTRRGFIGKLFVAR